MSIAFATRAPSGAEVERLRLALSSFCDGGGMLKDADGSTIPGWRDAERVVEEIVAGKAPEDKGIFDVFVASTETPGTDYGFSVKCKEQPPAVTDCVNGRVYMELANSPAKFWANLKNAGIEEADFTAQRHAQRMGQIVLQTVQDWHRDSAVQYKASTGRTVDLERSAYLTLSYTKKNGGGRGARAAPSRRKYCWHAFDLAFPAGIRFTYSSARCLRGEDPGRPGEALFDWYGLSGGQLKYYPLVSKARFASPVFELEAVPGVRTLSEKAARYWPDKWVAAKGAIALAAEGAKAEVGALAKLARDADVVKVLKAAEEELGNLYASGSALKKRK